MAREVVHYKSESQLSVQEIADFLRLIADKLSQEGSFQVEQGGQEFLIRPAGRTQLELKYETKGEKEKFEIEIEWRPGASQENIVIK
ncbi:amphi-Trp domain-containing protein [Heliorestis convoluta]|uniref:Amphi-Trp domain-containing protein n=1 Tax=Heliorestis convoluta TaxID=356322 RepID=A0A5Q2N2J5_9FIRM|nr:amphi-Trp domain-containing protein [Heliorestis convoluta]QGG49047.1 amphi-Trp domain-containing protein [Heliorestis convoluta]